MHWCMQCFLSQAPAILPAAGLMDRKCLVTRRTDPRRETCLGHERHSRWVRKTAGIMPRVKFFLLPGARPETTHSPAPCVVLATDHGPWWWVSKWRCSLALVLTDTDLGSHRHRMWQIIKDHKENGFQVYLWGHVVLNLQLPHTKSGSAFWTFPGFSAHLLVGSFCHLSCNLNNLDEQNGF